MNWRNVIYDEIKNRNGIVILIDPNQIVSNDEIILKKIADYGFDIFQYSDSLSVRYFIEHKKAEQPNDLKLLLIYNNSKSDAEREIPFDILHICDSNGGLVTFSLGDIFPNLNLAVVEKLDSKYYDKLFNECQQIYENKNESETKEFLLQKIFGISPITFSNNIKIIVRDLIDLHLSGNKIPTILSEYLISKIPTNSSLYNLLINDIIRDSSKFFEFLQKEWEKTVMTKKIGLVPFDHPSISNHLDNLFLMGNLNPVDIEIKDHPKWMKIGIKNYEKKLLEQQLGQQLANIEKEFDKLTESSSYDKWQNFSLIWANLCLKYYIQNQPSRLNDINGKINQKFSKWAETKYKSLRNVISDSPLMVHKILDYLIKEKQNSKIALIVVDGMSLPQWYLIKEYMKQAKPEIKSSTDSIFAWIPTVTSISRQSIFSGYEPYVLKDSLTKPKEESYWKTKWQDVSNLRKDQIFYKTNVKVWKSSQFQDIPLESEVLGLIINTIDDMMHSSTGGMKDMISRIKEWSQSSAFFDFLQKLLEHDYQVFITSDHGNIESIGIGEPKADFAEERGRRVRIYHNAESMNNSHNNIESKIWWPRMAGPDIHFLLPLGNNAFSGKDEIVVTHGGDSFEEVMVPFVKLWWENNC